MMHLTLNYPPPKIRHPLLASTLMLAFASGTGLFGASCDTPEDAACSPACDTGSTCDPVTNTCVAPRLERFDGPIPGRAVRLEMRKQRAFLAMIHPTEQR